MGISRYFKINNWKQRLIRKNKLVNKIVCSLQYDDLFALEGLKIDRKDLSSTDFISFFDNMVPNWQKICPDKYSKKFLEFYISYFILAPTEEDTFLDAAGGVDTYAGALPCRKKYLLDIKISERLKNKYGGQIKYIENDISRIPLPDLSVNKIACHHSFEHFQKKAIWILSLKCKGFSRRRADAA